MIDRTDLPATFYAKPPGIWQLVFWAAWMALSLLIAIAWWSEPIASGRFVIALGLTACFATFFAATRRRRQRDLKPSVVVSSNGLLFHPETGAERIVRWDQLRRIVDDRRGSIVFDTTDNKKLGDRAFFSPIGIYISATCRTRNGDQLAQVIPDLWREQAAASAR